MSAPHIIWTLRRTGGTTLAVLLGDLSEHPTLQHEPFNPDRPMGHLVRAWHDHADTDRLRADLLTALAGRPVIKHCHELLPEPFNRVLLGVTRDLGYAQVLLDRQAEIDRVLSLELASLTGAWGKQEARSLWNDLRAGRHQMPEIPVADAVAHLRFCRDRRAVLRQMFAEAGVTPFEISFEEVYADPEAGRARVAALMAHVGINPGEHVDYEARVTEALLEKGQKSGRLLQAVPNIDTVRAALSSALDERRGGLAGPATG